ncbi:hypothetical protein LOZ58_004480 [Ophidiomyces ophidiicola]|nr:hypothetical protein LOZ58_004480 [Ophidiomyces ophidiicola]
MVGIGGSALNNGEALSEPARVVESERLLIKTESDAKLGHEAFEQHGLPAGTTSPKTHLKDRPKEQCQSKNEEHKQTQNRPLTSHWPSNLPAKPLCERGDSSEDSQRSFQDSEIPYTPSRSMTSASLISPLPIDKPTTPDTQSRFTLGTPPSPSPEHLSLENKQKPAIFNQARPRSSIPYRLSSSAYAQQCVAAAHASRLNPYALHEGEQEILQDHLCHLHVTAYLSIRNGILRLWTRNPMLSVTKEEALGCAKDWRWMNLASVAYNWLVRGGYINFGCVDIPKNPSALKGARKKERQTIVIIGAGMAGLGCARQVQNLFQNLDENSVSPKVIVLEGRRRIGGRIYSHPLKSLNSDVLESGLRSTAEMGAQIVVGFDHGNPLDPIIRAQLALRYHLLRDISTIHDSDGQPADEFQDAMVEKLYYDILNRSGAYRHKTKINKTAEGNRELLDSGRDTFLDDGVTIKQYEDAAAFGTIDMLLPAQRLRRGVGHRTADIKPVVSPQLANMEITEEIPAALAYQAMGWKLRDGISSSATISLDEMAKGSETPTLGAIMDEAIRQCQEFLPLTPKDMRLLNWHYANLEYANAANLGSLSLSGWDQDMGNEFEGEHAQIIGGYQQVPQGLWSYPTKLDVRTNKIVSNICFKENDVPKAKARIHLADGEVITADKVVLTAPLGVLKSKSISFSPALPSWKLDAIDRLGFGVMNKVILVFETPFWDIERDMIGLLREPTVSGSLSQADYAPGRGKFYLFWNCIKMSGLPMLIALMAGDSAHQAEHSSDSEILRDVMSQLRSVFKSTVVTDPLETIITRWGQDKFSRGSYSYVAAEALPGDYDLMAKSIGNLYFAGEATCGTHPATVHGAYLSGLRAAREVFESIVGPVKVPSPLVLPKDAVPSGDPTITPSNVSSQPATTNSKKRKAPPSNINDIKGKMVASPGRQANVADDLYKEAYDKAMWDAIVLELGPAKPRPRKQPLNPFLLYQKDYWFVCKAQCDDAHRQATGNSEARAPRDEIRQSLGKMWRDVPEDIKKPYLEQIDINRKTNDEGLSKWKDDTVEWERRTYEVKDRWCATHPYDEFVQAMKTCLADDGSSKNF